MAEVRAMDVFVAALLAMQQAIFGVLAVIMSSKYHRMRYAVGFGALSAIGIALVIWQAVLAHQSNDAAVEAQLGDAERPPFVSVISLPANTWFVTVNNSDYPAYGTKIQLYDDANGATAIRSYNHPEMAAHLAIRDDKPWTPSDMTTEHHLTAQITTRTGLVREELILRKTDNNQWMRASRVRQGMRTLEQDVDSSWPRDEYGQVDWK
jgi:hypothetical protein